ncbi:translocation/assembly module TamB domain-containing protein [Saccharospirillum mangrovi]|uniref:translocation/assembly module TamB domain-containing protein n=1 Tax=Saccharospirillum mangrovi TaxID=2161747 RepID=UPI000D38CA3F|nr:translocation/assembly module TamB [Saccharospirillum mangrovi]
MAWRLRQGAARAWLIGLGSLLGLVLILALTLAWLLASESGRLTVLSLVEYALPKVTQQHLDTEGARSPSLGEWHFERLSWRSGDTGPAVDATDLQLHWQPSYLWQKRLWLEQLKAADIDVRIPAAEPSEDSEDNTGKPFSIPDVAALWAKLPSARLDQLDVDRLSLQHPALPDLSTTVRGELAVNWGSWPARLDVTLSEGDTSELRLEVNVDAVDALRIQGELNAPADSAWARAFEWPLPQAVTGEWDLELSQRQGQIQLSIDQLALPWREQSLRASGDISFDPNNSRLFFSEFDVSADGQPARVHGFIQADRADLSLHADALPLALARPWLPLDGLDGAVSVNGQLTGGWRTPRFAGNAAFTGEWRDEAVQLTTRSSATLSAVTIDQLDLSWGPAQLQAVGRVDWTQQRLDLTLEGQHIADRHWRPWVPAWPSAIHIDDANVSGVINGPLRQPVLNADLSASGAYQDQPLQLHTPVQLSVQQLTLADIDLRSDLGTATGHATIDFSALTLTANSRFSQVHSDWLPVFGARLPGDHDWTVDGQLDWHGDLRNPDAEGALNVKGQWQQQRLRAEVAVNALNLHRVQLGASQVELGDTQTGIEGTVNWRERRIDLNATPQGVRLASIRPFTPAWPTLFDELSGQIDGQLSLNGPWAQPRLRSDLTLNGQWQSTPLNAHLQVQAQQRQHWQIDHSWVRWGDAEVRYDGWLEPFAPALDGDFEVQDFTVEQLQLLPLTLPEPLDQLTGLANASGHISGPLLQPTLSDSQADFTGQLAQTPLQLQLELNAAGAQQLDIERLQLNSESAALTLSGQYQRDSQTVNMDADLTQLDWARVEPWLPDNLRAPLDTLTGEASGRLSAQGQWPQLTLDGQLRADGRFRERSFWLNWHGKGEWQGALDHSLNLLWGDAKLDGELSSSGEQLDGQLSVIDLDIEQLRALGIPLDRGVSGRLNADLGLAGSMMDPAIDLQLQATGQWQPVNIGLTEATAWRIDIDGAGRRDDWKLTRAEADLGQAGQLSLSGAGSMNALTLNGDVNIIDSRYWLANRPEWAGELAGDFELTGSTDKPEVRADLDWQSERWPLTLHLDLDTLDGEHRLNARLNENDIERLSVAVHTAQTALSDWKGEPTDRPFNAEFRFDTDSTVFDPFFQGRPDQDFSGQLQGRLTIDGSLTQPQWNGDLRLSGGRYENATYGAVLSDMNGELNADNRTLQLTLDASDDGGGRVGLAGSVVWPEEREVWWMPDLDLTMTTRNAHLLRRADMDASVSGEISVAGPWRDLLASGNVEVSPLTIQLNSLLQSGAPSLNIVRNDSTATDEDDAAAPRPLAPQGQWQVRLRADRRAQIYGQGLEAELSGELDLSDELTSPQVGGRFQVIRGTYTAFGKIFQITDGNIQVQGSQILLDITASYSNPELSVDLRITGTQDQLNLTLTSTPALANDELLARLLFGTSLNEMNAVQAFQLATALNSLRDPNSGLDLFGTTRELLGLDSLSLDSDVNEAGETGVNVQAGKYLSDQLYLQVESGVRTEQSFAGRLQFQVTPQVSLELYTNGQYGSGGLELNWSEDY